MMAQDMYNLPKIPFVFSNTGLELDATIDFIFNFDYENITVIKPKNTSFGSIIKKYGKPTLSKMKSADLKTYHNQLKKGNNVLDFSRVQNLIMGVNLKNGKKSHHKLANKHFHMLHPDYEISISQICCKKLKKEPFEEYAIEHDIYGYFTGMRKSEGGARSLQYKNCTSTKKIGKKTSTKQNAYI